MPTFWLIICNISSHALPSQIGSCPFKIVLYNGFNRCTWICVKQHYALQITPRVMSIVISTGFDRVAESLFLRSCQKGALAQSTRLKQEGSLRWVGSQARTEAGRAHLQSSWFEGGSLNRIIGRSREVETLFAPVRIFHSGHLLFHFSNSFTHRHFLLKLCDDPVNLVPF